MKTLGLLWDAKLDDLQYNVTIEETSKNTKRSVLSTIAQIYDPLGLLGLVVIVAKSIMQSMWQTKTGWDEILSQEMQTTWDEFYGSLPQINNMKIARNININPGNDSEEFDLVGYGDASEKAYGTCLYAVYRNTKGIMESHLICSKSRIAPLKTISLSRLELNATLLLAKLSNTAREAYGRKI